MLIGIHCYVSGKVQGVWFRASTKVEADNLGLTGWVRNLADGRVELQAFGTKEQLQLLQQWLHIGPPLADVSTVDCKEIPWQEHQEFKQV